MTPVVLLPKVRSTAITRSAYGMSCALRLPGICERSSATVVWAHLPGVGKSHASKVSDLHGCYACVRCHDAIDARVPTHLAKVVLLDAALRALCESQARLIEAGVLIVPDAKII